MGFSVYLNRLHTVGFPGYRFIDPFSGSKTANRQLGADELGLQTIAQTGYRTSGSPIKFEKMLITAPMSKDCLCFSFVAWGGRYYKNFPSEPR